MISTGQIVSISERNPKYKYYAHGLLWGAASLPIYLFENPMIVVLLKSIILLAALSYVIFYLPIKFSTKLAAPLVIILIYVSLLMLASARGSFLGYGPTLVEIVQLLMIVPAFFVLQILCSKGEIATDQFFSGIKIILIIIILKSIFQIHYGDILNLTYRLATAAGSNGLGECAQALFILSLFGFFKDRGKRLGTINVLFIILSLLVLAATKNRTGIFIAVMSFFYICYRYMPAKYFVTMCLILVAVVMTQWHIIEIILRIKLSASYGGDNTIYNLSGRTNIWSDGVRKFIANPFLGLGVGAYTEVYGGHQGFHNVYVQTIVESGILGLMCIMTIVSVSFFNIMRYKSDYRYKIIFYMGILNSFVESHLFNYGSPQNLMFFLTIAYYLSAPAFLERKI